jgi:hypothetical protein
LANPQDLVGRRFVTDFRVIKVADDEDQTVTLTMYGETYQISLEELQTLIDAGFITEAPDRPKITS